MGSRRLQRLLHRSEQFSFIGEPLEALHLLARAIKDQAPTQPILLLSAFTASITTDHPPPLPVDSMMAKPFSLQEFRKMLALLFPADGNEP